MFLKHIVSVEGQQAFSQTGNCVPVLTSLLNDEIKKSERCANILAYVRQNWKKTLRQPILKTEQADIILPYPFVSPCMDGRPFVDIYYWDTYFINLMLIQLGEYDYARGNLEDIAYLIGKYGYMPNYTKADGFLRSQPPLFSKGVEDFVSITNDRDFMKRMLPFMEKEYTFWQTERMTPIGLNRYGWNADDAELETFARNIRQRLHLNIEDCTAEKGGHLFAEAESGWDFSPRFGLRCADFCPIDLNSILYETENILAVFCEKCGEEKKPCNILRRQSRGKYACNAICAEKTGCIMIIILRKVSVRISEVARRFCHIRAEYRQIKKVVNGYSMLWMRLMG